MCIGMFLTLMDPALVAVALPEIQAEFDASVNQIFWVPAVFLLAFAVPMLITGRLGDRFGHRRIYLLGMVGFIAGAFGTALATTIEFVIAMRALQGLGASLLNPQPLSIINRIFPRSSRGQAVGIWAAVASSASLFGPVIGGVIVGLFDWRFAYALYLPAGLLALILVTLFVPRLPRSAPPIAIGSALLSLIALFGIVFGLQQGPELSWSPLIWASLGIGIAAFGWFIREQARLGERALMPLRLFRNRNFRLATIAVFALGFVNYSFQLPLMLFLQTVAGIAPQHAALIVVPMGIISVILSPVAGRLTDRIRPGILSPIGFGCMAAAFVFFVVLMLIDASIPWFILPVSLLGAALGLAWTPNSVIALRGLGKEIVGAGSGVYVTSRQVGAVVGVAALGATMQTITPASYGAAAAMAVPLIVVVMGAVAVCLFVDDRRA
ncbi:MFS transporter [Corynebacterium yudongzhengii]|uniref:MFS transporter n=1 Tax=Corynebacterium yudongzhengii TaxID=2080740 RepID=A0A2U1T9S3_9CORY|nr:MFS transporter [Corynebacterium yudongzhengii]AWB82993.1 MFS transporter [Corynebacterium yudongzhengii]PWC02675.1 MFS transporter [Corynebacterium yudongzhengii]